MASKPLEPIRKALNNWYLAALRPLPWRSTGDPYAIWVSEVMLQQTQVITVIPYYHRFLERFPDLESLASADQEAVLKLWEGLGYYARARNLHKASAIVLSEFGGKVPETYKAFRSLPGVGEYIAAAVLSIAFGKPYAVVDGNVKRVLARLFLLAAPVNVAASHKVFKEKADLLLDADAPQVFNQAMMELGATVCTPKNPLCGECPVRTFCAALKAGETDGYPKRKETKKVPEHQLAVAVIGKDGKLLITRRQENGLLGGLWEFPGGRLKTRETAEDACIREIRNAVNLEIEVLSHLTRVRHAYTHFRIVVDVFRCEYLAGEVELDGPSDHRWILPAQIGDFPFHGANHKFIPMLQEP